MKRWMILLTFCLLLLPGIMQEKPKDDTKPLVLTHVTVIDVTGSPPKPDMTVVIQGNKIAAVDKSAKVRIPDGARVIDATGQYLIPGLWDMHVHGTPMTSFAELYIANGVTGVRDMYWGLDEIKNLRKQMEEGKRVGPRIVAAGRIVDGPKPVWIGSVAVTTAEDGRKAVQTVKQEGSDFVKVYSLLPREGYFAIAKEAKKQKIPFAGHVPEVVSTAEASDAGQKSIEHLTGVLTDCSTKAAELRKERADALAKSSDLATFMSLTGKQSKIIAETYDEKTAQALFAKYVKNRTWHCPTLIVLRSIAHMDDPSLANDPRMKYMPAWIKSFWDPKNDFRFKKMGPEAYQAMKANFERSQQLVGAMRKAGVLFLSGTDTINPYCFPGFSLHDELALLVESGLTPLEALQAATINPARYLGKEQQMGTIAKGKLADLVLLDASPLADIRNTTRIHAVIANGKLFDQQALGALLTKAQGNNRFGYAPEPPEALHAGFCCLGSGSSIRD